MKLLNTILFYREIVKEEAGANWTLYNPEYMMTEDF